MGDKLHSGLFSLGLFAHNFKRKSFDGFIANLCPSKRSRHRFRLLNLPTTKYGEDYVFFISILNFQMRLGYAGAITK